MILVKINYFFPLLRFGQNHVKSCIYSTELCNTVQHLCNRTFYDRFCCLSDFVQSSIYFRNMRSIDRCEVKITNISLILCKINYFCHICILAKITFSELKKVILVNVVQRCQNECFPLFRCWIREDEVKLTRILVILFKINDLCHLAAIWPKWAFETLRRLFCSKVHFCVSSMKPPQNSCSSVIHCLAGSEIWMVGKIRTAVE